MDLQEIRKDRAGKVLQFSIPAVIAMVLTSLITVADGFFMGNYVGKEGIAAVNLGLPIVYLYLGVGLMVSIGGVAMAGMALGSNDQNGGCQIFNQTIATAFVSTVLLSCIMAFCLEPVMSVLHGEGEVARCFQEYYRVMLLELPVMVVNSSFGMFIRGEGNPRYYMKISIFQVVLNVLLDYLFSGCFHLGAAGIAAASLVSALASLAAILWFFLGRAEVYRLGKFRFNGEICRASFLNGSSEFIGEMSTGIAMFAYNLVIMRRFGADSVTAFTIVGYTAYMFSMVIIGFGQGASPLISFCYGAGERLLAADIRRTANRYVFGAGVAVFLLTEAVSGWYGGIFVASRQVQDMVSFGIRIFAVSFFFSGVNAITSFYFTAIGKAFESAVISSLRGVVVLLFCIFTLPVLFGMAGVWMAAPVTEMATFGATGVFLQKEKSRLL
ncbi:MATE family efflux transporter [Clostridiaceae bacterium]|nr:MATE family efflux transporter [Clostridiaceae bacterium]RKI13612.1 MATE family efflux transporter [bacterium 1XD21-70]